MKQIVFLRTQSGARTNILASFQLFDKEELLKKIKGGKDYGTYRYGFLNSGWVNNLKGGMSLAEFEEVFTPEEIASLTPEEVTGSFGAEISKKYGEHKMKAEIKTLTKKQLVPGGVYEDLYGGHELYLGVGTMVKTSKGKYGPPVVETLEGHCFKSISKNQESFPDTSLSTVSVLKGIRKYARQVRTVEIKKHYNATVAGSHWRPTVIYDLTLSR